MFSSLIADCGSDLRLNDGRDGKLYHLVSA